MSGPVRLTAVVLVALVVALHAPVFLRGALITPAGGQYGLWPWKAYGRSTIESGALVEHNDTLSDLLFQVYPWQLYTARSLQGGWIPLWNPYSYCGVPFVANAQSAIFYPLHWPAWVIPSMRVFTAAILMKILLAGLFMAVFLRGLSCGTVPCLVGSVSFALCGFMTAWLGYAHTNVALLLPLLMHASRLLAVKPATGPFLLAAFAGAAQYLGGHPETSLHVVGVSLIYFLWNLRQSSWPRLAAGLYFGASLLGFAMSAVQTLPFLQYLGASAALRQRQVLAGMDPSLPGDAPLTLLLPGHYGRVLESGYHGPVPWQALAGYAGAGVLLLALLSLRWWPRARFFVLLGAASAAIVYGPSSAREALRLVPVLGITSNNRLLLIVSFCLATLAALGLEGLASSGAVVGGMRGTAATGGTGAGGRGWLLGAIGAGGAALVIIAVSAGGGDPIGARLGALFVGGTALFLFLLVLRPSSARIYLAGIAAITCLDMLQYANGFNPHADPDALFRPTRLTDFIRQDAGGDMARGGRLMTIGWTMRPETQMPYWLSSIEGYDAMEFADYRHLLDRAQVGHIHETGEIPDGSRALLDLLGTRYLVTPPGGVVSGEGMRIAYDGSDGRVFVNDRARPRLSFVTGGSIVSSAQRESALEALAAGRVPLDREAVIESESSVIEMKNTPAGSPVITLEGNTPGSLLVRVRGQETSGLLVVGDSFDPGWEASVNGIPAPVYRADYLFMAVPVPPGEASVTLTYRPLSFRAGAWISAVSLMFSIVVGLMRLAAARDDRAT